jgi:C4-dicarboxylate transporter, DctM subunit
MIDFLLTDLQIGLISIGVILILIYAGMHVAIALALTSFIGVWLIRDNLTIATRLLSQAAADSISSYVFGVVPLFVLMGLLMSVSDIGKDMFDVANRVFARIRGGLGIATVAANAVFAAVTGISIASAAVFTKVAVPEMIRLGYKPRFSVGVVAGSSVLGMLIPPSLLLILFGILTETSIGDLFTAGILPGILLAGAYIVFILAVAYRFPNYVSFPKPDGDDSEIQPMGLLAALWKLLPIMLLIVLVLGGIYAGWFTPTESGAVGALGALVIALGKRRMSWSKLWQVLTETGHVTVAVLFLIISATMYGRMLALAGVTQAIGSFIGDSGLGLYSLLLIYIVIVLLMGTILDSSSILMIIVPLAYPVMSTMGVDMVWFGIVTIIAVEVGLITPPLGIAAYVVKSTLDDQRIGLDDVFAGSFPFVLIMILVLGMVVAFPSISLVLIR